MQGDAGLIPGSGRSPGEENGNPFQKYIMFLPTKGEIYVFFFHIALFFFFFKGNLTVFVELNSSW